MLRGSADRMIVRPRLAASFSKPRREVYGRADAGEIQPVTAADIAVEHLAEMQR